MTALSIALACLLPCLGVPCPWVSVLLMSWIEIGANPSTFIQSVFKHPSIRQFRSIRESVLTVAPAVDFVRFPSVISIKQFVIVIEWFWQIQRQRRKMSQVANCPNCSKPVYSAEEIAAAGGKYHKSCMRCSTCTKKVENSSYAPHQGKLFCRSCYKIAAGITGFGMGRS